MFETPLITIPTHKQTSHSCPVTDNELQRGRRVFQGILTQSSGTAQQSSDGSSVLRLCPLPFSGFEKSDDWIAIRQFF